MTPRIIITLVVFTALFIAWFYFTVKLTPDKRRKDPPKSLRILFITGGLFLVALPLLVYSKNELPEGVLAGVFGITFIYRGFKGWLINPN
jgi:hypothetical protein